MPYIAGPEGALLPLPRRFAPGPGGPGAVGVVDARFADASSARLVRAVERLNDRLGRRNGEAGLKMALEISCAIPCPEHPQLGQPEAYQLNVTDQGARLVAETEWGVLHGLETLFQLATAPGGLGCVAVDDAPRFPWRGLLLDVARHYLGMDALLRTLDAMAQVKLNVLHLHLTDDQAFRFPSERFPELASPRHYSRRELAELINHAADRGIRVVPEIDVPGHTTCWLVARPDWGTGVTTATRRFGVHEACLDPTSEAVYAALAELLGEVAEVFPDRHLHLGGDEVHPAWWSASDRVQTFMSERGMTGLDDMQAHFNSRVARTVSGLGKRPMGWDEVVHDDLPDDVVVQSWRGATARDRALGSGHDCVVSSGYYLDLFYPADVHYRFDPQAPESELVGLEDALLDDPRFEHVAEGMRWTEHWREPAGAAGAAPGSVLGAEACLWGELVTEELLDVRLWSRLPALAERFWSPRSVRDLGSLYQRLGSCFEQLAAGSGVDVRAASRALMARAGADEDVVELLELLEPVKWYGRLLGEEALAARIAGTEMPQARPYDADTPLDRVVDALFPESLPARRVARLCQRHFEGDTGAVAGILDCALAWQDLGPRPDCPADVAPALELLCRVGEAVVDVLEGCMAPSAALSLLETAARPQGEYLIAVVPPLRSWLAGLGG
ncbi:MAG TPA: family 20 glycosylhydrolase [Pseudomonadales bacterium]